jgi:hypothetical protein
MNKNSISILTFFILFLGLVLAVLWFLRSAQDAKFEPVLAIVGLFATLTGIFAERQAANYERKRELLLAFYRELIENQEILQGAQFNCDPETLDKPLIFPMLISSTSEIAIASGVFAEENSMEIFSDLQKWRDTVNSFNHRLHITELRTFTNPDPVEIRSFYSELLNSGWIDKTLALNKKIANNLRLNYLKKPRTKTLKSAQ